MKILPVPMKDVIKYWLFMTMFALLIFISGCAISGQTPDLLNISILIEGDTRQIDTPPGLTVEETIELAGFTLDPLDRTNPPGYTIISENMQIQVFRVSETFETEEVILPFDTQTMKNETLPEGQTLLVQAGVNGVLQNTYRTLYENETLVSRSLNKQELIIETRPEIIMVGIQSPFTQIEFPGKIAYLSAGNAWVMEGTSGQRQPLVTTGDLDGRIFSLSPDGSWLLFTRVPSLEGRSALNELWFLDTSDKNAVPVYLHVDNIIHFAGWRPGTGMTIAYSTTELRETAPGWQANNDLILLSFDKKGVLLKKEVIIETNSGGIYGWWGTDFLWSKDGSQLAFSRPDSIGLVDFSKGEFTFLCDILPFQTRSDWAWTSGIAWSPQAEVLYFTQHGSPASDDETSPIFSLAAKNLTQDYAPVLMVESTGMFAYPVSSPNLPDGYLIAFIQAAFPEQSDKSRYDLYIMDQDGSNRKKIFPSEGSANLEPQSVKWGAYEEEENRLMLAFIDQGNLWLVNSQSMNAQQLTGDGSISKIDWK